MEPLSSLDVPEAQSVIIEAEPWSLNEVRPRRIAFPAERLLYAKTKTPVLCIWHFSSQSKRNYDELCYLPQKNWTFVVMVSLKRHAKSLKHEDMFFSLDYCPGFCSWNKEIKKFNVTLNLILRQQEQVHIGLLFTVKISSSLIHRKSDKPAVIRSHWKHLKTYKKTVTQSFRVSTHCHPWVSHDLTLWPPQGKMSSTATAQLYSVGGKREERICTFFAEARKTTTDWRLEWWRKWMSSN